MRMEPAAHDIEMALSDPLIAECLNCGHSSVLPKAFNQHCLRAAQPSAMLRHLFFRLICSVCWTKNARIVLSEGTILMSRDQIFVAQRGARAGEREPKSAKPIPRKLKPARPAAEAAGPHHVMATTPRLARAPDECIICRCQIEPERLAILPGANTCVDCSRKKSSGTKRKVAEPRGSREDWKKDSGGNFARAAKPKI
jgi:hypothetical protein